MGRAAKSEITIYLKEGVENTPFELSSKTAIEQALLEFYFETNPEKKEQPCITVVSLDTYEGSVELELYSGRVQNLEFQVELLEKFLSTKLDDEIEEVTYSKWSEFD